MDLPFIVIRTLGGRARYVLIYAFNSFVFDRTVCKKKSLKRQLPQ